MLSRTKELYALADRNFTGSRTFIDEALVAHSKLKGCVIANKSKPIIEELKK
jgi:hypothetical protein